MKTALLSFFLAILLLAASCGDDNTGCDDSRDFTALDATFTFRLINGEENVLSIVNYPCWRDSVTILPEGDYSGELVRFEQNGTIEFYVTKFDEDHSAALFSSQERTFFLYINYLEQDTISFRYQMRDVGCGSRNFDFVETYYNGQLLLRTEDNPRIISRTILKEALAYNPCP